MSAYALDRELTEALAAFPGGFDPGAHLRDMDVVRMLRSTPDLLRAVGGALPTDERVSVEDLHAPGTEAGDEIPVRIYRACERVNGAGACAGLVFLHGGAFVIGDVYTEELRCLSFAAEANCVVVSVGYRLAPESPYPAASDDAFTALCWIAEHAGELGVDPQRIGVAGSSAGGALAAGTAMRARDLGGPTLAFQLLVYPVVDDRMVTPSMRAFDSTPIWTSGATADMWDLYLGSARRDADVSPYASPGRATDLAGLPPAYVLTAEYDPLRDEGIDYARGLMHAGVPTELHCMQGAFHGFDILAPNTAISRLAVCEQVSALVRGLGSCSVEQTEGAPA